MQPENTPPKSTMNFTALLSLYAKESPDYLRQSLASLVAQSQPAAEVLIVLDGAITPALEAVLAEFAERNWQSDARYTEAYIHSKSRQHGSLRLKQALAQQGIDETLSREFMPDKAHELQTAVAVLRKKFKQPAADLKDKQKQARFLAYRGFDMDTIHAALKSSWDEDDVFEFGEN